MWVPFRTTVLHTMIGFGLSWVANKWGLSTGYEFAMGYWLTLIFLGLMTIRVLREDLQVIYIGLDTISKTLNEKKVQNEVSKQETP